MSFWKLAFSLLCLHLMQNYRVSNRFSRTSDSALNVFTTEVINAMTGNPAYPAPLVPLGEMADLQNTFGEAMTVASVGGQYATAVKNSARAALLSALRRQASYVQGVAKHDVTQLLSSGFKAASQNRAQTQLAAPAIRAILNERSEQLTLRLTPIANARNYQVQIQIGEGGWREAGIFLQARRIVLANLTPGTIYKARVRALGGSTGYSDWSDAKSRMSL
jgi:hypothetical protein